MKVDVLGIKIDKITLAEVVVKIEEWLTKPGKHYIVTPNIEFIMAAQSDAEFKNILNEADLAIPDSARIGWADKVLREKYYVLRVLFWPFFIAPRLISNFPVTTGTDLMEELIKESAKRGYTIGLIGGRDGVAEKLKECLLKEHPSLKITYANSDIEIDYNGITRNTYPIIPNTDLLFVAFGHIKQEKWISKNIKSSNVKVMIGVGGAFDYLSGDIKRAPVWIRKLGFEWVYRLIIQPWRIKRFGSLVKFVLTCLP